MKQTIYPDSRGRAFLLSFLKKLGWKEGDAVEVDFVKILTCNLDNDERRTNE